MLFSTMHQGLLFLWMAAAGALVFLWYLLLRGLRRLVQAGFALSLGCDLLFGAGAAVILLFFLVSGCCGALRPFALLAAALGFGLCAVAVLPLVHGGGLLLHRLHCRISTHLHRSRLLRFLLK